MAKSRRRRFVSLKAKPGQLRGWYGKADGEGPDTCTAWQTPAQKGDGYVLLDALAPLAKELARRGYDLRTLRFSIEKAATS